MDYRGVAGGTMWCAANCCVVCARASACGWSRTACVRSLRRAAPILLEFRHGCDLTPGAGGSVELPCRSSAGRAAGHCIRIPGSTNAARAVESPAVPAAAAVPAGSGESLVCSVCGQPALLQCNIVACLLSLPPASPVLRWQNTLAGRPEENSILIS